MFLEFIANFFGALLFKKRNDFFLTRDKIQIGAKGHVDRSM